MLKCNSSNPLEYKISRVHQVEDCIIVDFYIINTYSHKSTETNYLYAYSDRWSVRLDYSDNIVTSYEYEIYNRIYELTKSKNFKLLYSDNTNNVNNRSSNEQY